MHVAAAVLLALATAAEAAPRAVREIPTRRALAPRPALEQHQASPPLSSPAPPRPLSHVDTPREPPPAPSRTSRRPRTSPACAHGRAAQGKPPNCPQLLAAAQTKMATAAKALDAANTNLNTTEAGLDKIVDAARQNQTTHDTAYQSALNLYNDAVGQHEKAQNQYNLDEGSLDNIQKECQQPIHPTNCPTLISNAKKQIATDESNLENTQEAIGVAQKSLNSVRRAPRASCQFPALCDDAPPPGGHSAVPPAQTKAALDEATALYWAAVKDKSDTVAELEAAIKQAITNQQQAVESYEEVVAECK